MLFCWENLEQRSEVKIIDFGKNILLSNPLKYSLNHAERMKYNKYHRHLAYLPSK